MNQVRPGVGHHRADEPLLRARYLNEVLDVLYPGHTSVPAGTEGITREFVVLPNARRPRLLVPVADRRLTAPVIGQLTKTRGRPSRVARRAAVAMLRVGVGRVLLRDKVHLARRASLPRRTDTIDEYVNRVLGGRYTVAIHIAPARANRRPVLRLVDPHGVLVGVATLGTTTLSRQLVRAEATALTALAHARLETLTVPKVLHAGTWRDNELLIQSPLPVWRTPLPVTPASLTAAMREVAGCCGMHRAPLAESRYWLALRERLELLADAPEGRRLLRMASAFVDAQPDLALRLGAWHGDWTAWNSAATGEGLLVWSWERFATDVPVGFDILHHALHQALDAAAAGRATSADAVLAATLEQAPAHLFAFGVPDHAAARAIARLYLFDISARYLADRLTIVGAGRSGRLGRWILPAVLREIGRDGAER